MNEIRAAISGAVRETSSFILRYSIHVLLVRLLADVFLTVPCLTSALHLPVFTGLITLYKCSFLFLIIVFTSGYTQYCLFRPQKSAHLSSECLRVFLRVGLYAIALSRSVTENTCRSLIISSFRNLSNRVQPFTFRRNFILDV
jgi:hypothetical protein